ncbi:hypothetical protein [Ornithinibacillus contaminans]|uniref:hypothetical protein n=1 Tax=Ornithinibacillus contaminans TaxID=694055 RepID=UPI00064D8F79|nr:hypothetical protein [Ornithinibacillus contaminans]
MHFHSKQHETNFKHLIAMVFPHANKDVEYKAMCYIQSLPEIYRRCNDDPMLHEFPFLWTTNYVNTSREEYDDDTNEKYYLVDFEVEKDSEGKEVNSERYNDLSHGYKIMVEFGANLFNSSNDEFNLTEAFGTWDSEMIKVFYQALEIRFSSKNLSINI